MLYRFIVGSFLMSVVHRARPSTTAVFLVALSPALSLAAESSDTTAPPVDRIVVSASATEQRLRDAPAAVTVISREELLSRPVRDVLDAVREVPGISLRGINFTRQGIQIRGLNPGQTLYLIDGRRVSNSADVIAHADFELSWIPIEAIERIEVVRGPLSSLYGSEALGGVINIITRPIEETWSGSIRLQGGQPTSGDGGNEFQAGAFASGRIGDNVGLRLQAETQYRGQTPVDDDPGVSDIEGRRLQSVGATVAWYLSDTQRLEIMASGGEETRERLTRGQGPLANTSYRFWDDITRRMGDVRYTAEVGDGQFQIGAYRAELDRENRRELTQPSSPTRLRDSIADASWSFGLGARQEILVGAEARRERLIDGGFQVTGEESVNRYALFIQDRIQLSDPLTLTLGGRWDHHGDFGGQFTPRAYLNWHVSDAVTLRGGYGEGFKAPTLKQLSSQFVTVGGGGRFTIGGNPDLDPERSRNLEVGILVEGERFHWETTVFQNNAMDLIETACIANCGAFGAERRQYVNVARARIRGTETGLGVTLGGGFEAGISHTWLDAVDRQSGQALVQRPEHTLVPRLSWQGGPWAMNVRAQYTGTQEIQVGPRRESLPSYTLWHVNASRDLPNDFIVRMGIENLTNVRLSERSSLFNYAERGRFINLGIDWSF